MLTTFSVPYPDNMTLPVTFSLMEMSTVTFSPTLASQALAFKLGLTLAVTLPVELTSLAFVESDWPVTDNVTVEFDASYISDPP